MPPVGLTVFSVGAGALLDGGVVVVVVPVVVGGDVGWWPPHAATIRLTAAMDTAVAAIRRVDSMPSTVA